MRCDDDEWRPGDERKAHVVEGIHDLSEYECARPAEDTLQPFVRGDEFGQGRVVSVWGHPGAFWPLVVRLGRACERRRAPSACGADVVIDAEQVGWVELALQRRETRIVVAVAGPDPRLALVSHHKVGI